MKNIIRSFLSVLLLIGVLLYAPFVRDVHEDEHIGHIHVYVMGAADYGRCSRCGSALEGDVIYDATCTEDGSAEVWCNNDSCNEYGMPQSFTIPALGHDWVDHVVLNPATCTETGLEQYTCSRCSATNKVIIDALGHDYRTIDSKEATCTEDGFRTTKCTRCEETNTTILKALGHDWKTETKEATCTEDGIITQDCSRCNEHKEEIIPALGHDLDEVKIISEATCTEDGLKSAFCKRCSQTVEEKIEKLGHDFPDTWTVEKEPTLFAKGLEVKICSRCGERLEQEIPAKDKTPLLITGGAILLAAGGWLLFRKRRFSFRRTGKSDPDLFKPAVEDKTVLFCGDDEKMIEKLKDRHYLSVSTCEEDEFRESVEENEPDITICHVMTQKKLREISDLKKEEGWEDHKLGLLVKQRVIDSKKKELDKLVDDEVIVDYLPIDAGINDVMIKLILPILKPKFNSDETLENIGGIADLLGIPGVSRVLDLYVNGRDIKATLEEGELGISGTAVIISDIAYILGFDTVGDVANLVDDFNKIRKATDSEAGAYEAKKGMKAGKDVVDVVSDLIDK